ncbi:MAG: 4Fe-4S binding protein [Verrucomicrobia bacterium]|nr:4Fe-4S binding protein [Verrucomicrobiota bacterium]
MNPGRRRFIEFGGRLIGAAALGGVGWRVFGGADPEAEFSQPKRPYVWRINTDKCTFCGKCETACVRNPSAVKAVNDQVKCSYCVACYGHLAELTISSDKINSEGKRVCPYDAVLRKEFGGGKDGYHLYTIDQEHCTGCGKCTKRCNELGTKSMFLVIRPELCIGCNRCAIAAVCPDHAIELVHCYPEDDYRGDFELDQELKRMEEADMGGMEDAQSGEKS